MNNIFQDIWAMISSMSFIDFVLYFAVVILIVLVVSLIYVMYTEKMEAIKEVEEFKKEDTSEKEERITPIVEEPHLEKQIDEFDLLSVIDEINENPKPIVDMTSYEEEQEQRAIISYDELLAASKSGVLYDKEEMVDDVIPVKKLSLNAFEKPKEITYLEKEPKIEIEQKVVASPTTTQLFSYEKEEAFLKALQQLNELLN